MREAELRRFFRRAVFTGSLVMVGAAMPNAAAAQTPATDPAATQRDMDYDDDGMDLGWIGLLGLAGLLGLRRRDNVDTYNTTTRKP
jgi:hypothetical protein